MEWLNTLMLFLLVLLLLIIYWYVSIPKNLPPGPIGLPLLGYVPFVHTEIYKTFNDLGKTYGSISHLYMGSQLMIILNDFDVIKEAFIKQGNIFGGRPRMATSLKFLQEWFQGIIFMEGDYWKQHRRFIIHKLKDYGVGKSTLEPLIMDEIHYFLKEIQNHNGKPFEMLNLLSISMANNIYILVSGKRLDYFDPISQYMAKQMKECEKITNMLNYFIAFPWTNDFFKLIFHNHIKKGLKINEEIVRLIKTVLSDVRNKFIFGQSENYLQSYLTERETRIRKTSKENIFTEEGLIYNTRDLLVAGTDTSATTLTWAAILMATFPKIQMKVQQEIDQIIGRNRQPTYNDRINTPYTEATIFEVHRFATITPSGIPHRTVKSTTFNGYYIPENALVYPNIWAVHHDPRLWGDPENFRPERFINSNGECVKPEYLIPFSIGKRACPGEPLARMELFLYFVCILQQFNFVAANGKMPSLDSIYRITVSPKSDLICLQPRKD